MKLLILGLFPVLIFWFVEEKFGTFWGLIAAMVWAVGECIYEFSRNRRIEKLTLVSTLLVLVLGGLGAVLDKSILFKFQPSIIELVFAGIIIVGSRGGEPFLLKMARQTRPEMFNTTNVQIAFMQKQLMTRLTRSLLVVLIIHVIVLTYVAIRGTTGQWAFWKGIGFNIFLGIWLLAELVIIRLRRKSG